MNQRFIYPDDLFNGTEGALASDAQPNTQDFSDSEPWTCVWTLPRQEKKLSQWLSAREMPHFLPVTIKETVSHRRKRVTEQPLFPSYLFVRGEHTKKAFMDSRAVAGTINPSGVEAENLSASLSDIWRGLNSGAYFKLVNQLQPGDLVEVTKGPFKGMNGHFENYNDKGSLVVWINVLGVGASLELDDPTVVRPLNKEPFEQELVH